jgi:molybdopterin molybdotransferase
MVEIRKPIQVKEAVAKVIDCAKQGEIEYVGIEDCDGRYLAEPLTADHDVPPFDKSPYDGFALRSDDTKHASTDNPVQLEVIEEIGAG